MSTVAQLSTESPPRGRARQRTLWDEGRWRGRLVVLVSAMAVLTLAWLDVSITGALTLLFDVPFVVVCLVAALAVRPGDFFAVGVMPPLLMLGTIVLLAAVDRVAVAHELDGMVQAVVSGLAHHAGALVTGHVVTLAVLGLRQVALRNAGRLRSFA